ncbi:hypothetical protein PaeBR_18675 [Paenibacillus sp. BR2-3]|uniref:hypothetical protein n=1 Tax=Paenibacillus sp. BR2-3 TaxID=3048494 RepID=UPI00397791EE
MKKFVAGIIVGGFLFAGASVFADSSSLIGQKVQGLFSVEKAGTKVADAIVINGTAYAPVRAVSDATGTELTVDGKRIIIQEKEAQITVSETNSPIVTPSVSEKKRLSDIEGYTDGIENRKKKIETLEALLEVEQNKLKNALTAGDKQTAEENIQELELRIKQEQESLVQAETKLAELQK